MKQDKFMFDCDVCGSSYQHGPHRYVGHALKFYGDLFCCDTCWKGNWDGWSPHLEPILLKHLERQQIPVPERNSKRLLPRE